MLDGEVKNKLSPAQVSVMRHKVTEAPYFGRYWDFFERGMYGCAACGTDLFSSDEKFDSKTGWPSFRKPIADSRLQFKNVAGQQDKIEVRCKKCKSHLGFVINTAETYYRMNSVALIFKKEEQPVIPAPVSERTDAPKTAVPVIVEGSGARSRIPLVLSALAGLIVGIVSMYFYYGSATYVDIPQSATSTSLFATSTDTVATSTAKASKTTATSTKPRETTIHPAPESEATTTFSTTTTP
jgi:peptide-methionine (R)-S-oxide reductase